MHGLIGWQVAHGAAVAARFALRFAQNQSGATAIEYGLIASLISIAVITAGSTLGKNISNTFSKVAQNVK